MTRTSFEIERIVAAGGKPQGYPDGGIIFIKGDRGECAYAVQSGRVEIREAGRVIEALEPGELFGEMALSTKSRGAPRRSPSARSSWSRSTSAPSTRWSAPIPISPPPSCA